MVNITNENNGPKIGILFFTLNHHVLYFVVACLAPRIIFISKMHCIAFHHFVTKSNKIIFGLDGYDECQSVSVA